MGRGHRIHWRVFIGFASRIAHDGGLELYERYAAACNRIRVNSDFDFTDDETKVTCKQCRRILRKLGAIE